MHLDGVRDGVQATIGLVEQFGDTLGEKTRLYGGFGNEQDGLIELSDLKPNIIYKEAQDKGLIDDKLTLPDFDKDPETVAGNITKGVTQFLQVGLEIGQFVKVSKQYQVQQN